VPQDLLPLTIADHMGHQDTWKKEEEEKDDHTTQLKLVRNFNWI
jgi:hypothetical protein